MQKTGLLNEIAKGEIIITVFAITWFLSILPLFICFGFGLTFLHVAMIPEMKKEVR